MNEPEPTDAWVTKGVHPLQVEELGIIQACEEAIYAKVRPHWPEDQRLSVVSELCDFAKKYEDLMRRKYGVPPETPSKYPQTNGDLILGT